MSNNENSISLPNQPTRRESPETPYHLYLTERTKQFAEDSKIQAIIPNESEIDSIGEKVRIELNVRGLRIQNNAPHIGYIVMRTAQTDWSHPFKWDALLNHATSSTPYYEYHPHRKPEPTLLGAIVASARTNNEPYIQQITVGHIDTFSQHLNDINTIQKTAESFLTGIYNINPDNTLEAPSSWGQHIGMVFDNFSHAGDYYKQVPEAVAKRWVIEKGELPFTITKS